ncbi:MAG: GMC family oxidoreductase, partial [Thaumarchaeota archaeon]|nr:GMC family oxidoreductase [Nitrososphaerota archaeon]
MGQTGPPGMNTIFGVDDYRYRRENYEKLNRDVLESCDVCVIGSGAAGAILAKKLCDAGKSVVLLEKGGYYEGEDMNQRDEDMVPLLWKNSGANFTEDLRIAIAQGSCLGGSTVINDAVCFTTPDVVRRQWRAMGVRISDDEWDAATAEVSKEIHVTKVSEEELDRNSLLLRKGCEKMGYLCHLGCHYETKQDMRVTYIHKALSEPNAELRIYCNCSAERITHSDGVVDGLEGSFLDPDGNQVYKIRVNARLVVVAAGSIASSHLLLRNGIAVDTAGKGLALHPAPFVLGDFPFEVRAHQGIPMAYTLHEFGVTNGVEDGGFLVEGIFLPPFQFSMALPVSGGQHEELMKRYNHYAMAGVLVRDGSNGTINLTSSGSPRVSYTLGPKEVESIAKGVEVIAKMWFKLGATRVLSSHMNKPILNGEKEIAELIAEVRKHPGGLLLGSAHPQGGNRMGSDPRSSVVDSDGKVHGFKNLFVCDASVFPTAVGVNPQLTVMTLATIVANRIDARWNEVSAQAVKERLGEVCSIRQPMFCGVKRLEELYEVSDTVLPSDALVNSEKMEIVEGENWSFDADKLEIWNNRYWKGFFATDRDLVTTSMLYLGGFWKKFSKSGGSVSGVTHPYEAPVFAKNQPIDIEYPGFGKVIHLKYLEPQYERFYDLLKIVDKDTILGKAFAGRNPPRGEQMLTFSMSRRYGIDFMTQDDFKTIFASKARRPGTDEVLGQWEGRLVSDSTLSPVMFRFRYYKKGGELKCDYIFGGILPGTSEIKFSQEMMLMFDFTGQLFHDEIRMVRRDLMLGRYCSMSSPLFKLLERAPSFIMKDGDRLCLPYLIRRV